MRRATRSEGFRTWPSGKGIQYKYWITMSLRTSSQSSSRVTVRAIVTQPQLYPPQGFVQHDSSTCVSPHALPTWADGSSLVLLSAAWAHPAQAPFQHASTDDYAGPHTPRVHYNMIPEHAGFADPPSSMRIQPIHTSGSSAERVDLTFFSDGCESAS